MPRTPSSFFDRLFDGANPVFALTVRLRTCRQIFAMTSYVYFVAAIAIVLLGKSQFPFLFGISNNAFFEICFLAVTCCVLVFLGSDFGTVFIEATFKDELLRLTPITPLEIVQGGFFSSLFYSSLLLCLTFPLFACAWLLELPVRRVFYGTGLLFIVGQTLAVVLLSTYIGVRNWREIGFGAVMVFLLILSFVGFCFTGLGGQLVDSDHWARPMFFLLIVSILIFILGYGLARNHAEHPHRTFRQIIVINLCVYLPVWLIACILAVVWPS